VEIAPQGSRRLFATPSPGEFIRFLAAADRRKICRCDCGQRRRSSPRRTRSRGSYLSRRAGGRRVIASLLGSADARVGV